MRGCVVSPDKPRIYLTGFMCSGKSAVGPLLADALNWEFTDTDAVVEEMAGASVEQIFGTQGEPCFRSWESNALARVSAQAQRVVALGGGTLMEPENRRVVSESGILVYLCWSQDVLFERIADSTGRPLAPDRGDRREALRRLFAERRAGYEAADIILKCESGMTPEEISQLMLHEILEM